MFDDMCGKSRAEIKMKSWILEGSSGLGEFMISNVALK